MVAYCTPLFDKKAVFEALFSIIVYMDRKKFTKTSGLAALLLSATIAIAGCGDNGTSPNNTETPAPSSTSSAPTEELVESISLIASGNNTLTYSLRYNPDGANPSGEITITVGGWTYGPTDQFSGTITPKIHVGTYTAKAHYKSKHGDVHDEIQMVVNRPDSMAWETTTTAGSPEGWNAELTLTGAPIVSGTVTAYDSEGNELGEGTVDPETNTVSVPMPAKEAGSEKVTFKYSGDQDNPESTHSVQASWRN